MCHLRGNFWSSRKHRRGGGMCLGLLKDFTKPSKLGITKATTVQGVFSTATASLMDGASWSICLCPLMAPNEFAFIFFLKAIYLNDWPYITHHH